MATAPYKYLFLSLSQMLVNVTCSQRYQTYLKILFFKEFIYLFINKLNTSFHCTYQEKKYILEQEHQSLMDENKIEVESMHEKIQLNNK